MAKRLFRIEFEAEDANGLMLPINTDTVVLSVKPSGEEHWSEVGGVVSIKLSVEADPAHPADNQFEAKLVNLKDYSDVDLQNAVTEKIKRKS